MGVWRAQHVEPERAVFRLVVDEPSLPGEQSLIFQALDGLARRNANCREEYYQLCPCLFITLGRVSVDLVRQTTVLKIVAAGLESASDVPAHPKSCSTSSIALRASALSEACGGIGSPTS